jgi:TctA family transporter
VTFPLPLNIDSDGNLQAFFERPIAATLGAMTLAVWFLPLLMQRLRRLAGISEAA